MLRASNNMYGIRFIQFNEPPPDTEQPGFLMYTELLSQRPHPVNERIDALIETWLWSRYRHASAAFSGVNGHLRNCAVADMAVTYIGDSAFNCDTGCSYVKWETVISCCHGQLETWNTGAFGELADVLQELEAMDTPADGRRPLS